MWKSIGWTPLSRLSHRLREELLRGTLLILLGSLAGVIEVASAQAADDVTEYAKACYTRLGIMPLAGPFRCKDGNQLVTTVDGKIQDINCPKTKPDGPSAGYYTNCPAGMEGKPNPDNAGNFPATCDYPSWLPNPNQCYGNSYIQNVPGIKDTDGNPSTNVLGAVLCRHKLAWSDGDKDFPDIAMILHNMNNGETCWFQTDDSSPCAAKCSNDPAKMCTSDSDCTSPGVCNAAEPRCDGTNVPAPDTAPAKNFFLSPAVTAGINCVRCHDNGPWMNSRWMNKLLSCMTTRQVRTLTMETILLTALKSGRRPFS